ncbi:MAG: cellulase family glycosylhydrolase [Lachnospiraceae bacterium]|nr:cellulase family glycosylhydrolase [Lachnospiraceae bacterium]
MNKKRLYAIGAALIVLLLVVGGILYIRAQGTKDEPAGPVTATAAPTEAGSGYHGDTGQTNKTDAIVDADTAVIDGDPTGAPEIAPTDIAAAADNSAADSQATAVPTSVSEPSEVPTAAPAPTDILTATVAPTEAPTGVTEPTEAPEPTKAPTAAPEPTKAPTVTPVPTKALEATPVPTKAPKDTAGLACPSVNGALQVIGSQLCDAAGNAVQLRGISTHGLAWFPAYVNQALFSEMREDWNVNIVRLAMYTDEYGGYCSGGDKSKLKKLIKDGVSYATKADMYVIVDWHVLNDRDPNKYVSDAKTFFDEMSKEFASNNNVIYEICNEPNGGTSWADIKKYAAEVIPVIRANDKNAVIIVGTPNWSQYVDQAAADPVKGETNIMYALHFYAATHKDDLRNKLKNAVNKGLPVFVTEYGICDASGSGSIDTASANKWVELMDSCGISYVCWNLSNKNETSALIKSSCRKTSGFNADDMSEEGTWLLDVLSKVPGAIVSINDTKTDDTGKDNGKTDNGGTGTGTGNTGNDDKSTGDAQKFGDQGILPASGKTGDIAWECSVSNSWESEGKTFCQYDITVKNTSKSAVDSWKITIDASANPSISNIWCAKAEVSGKTITVTNESFNGMINAGESVSGIGIIVSD